MTNKNKNEHELHPSARPLRSREAILAFLFAGNATLSLRSRATGKHYTFNVSRANDNLARYFVKVLASPDQYIYIGMLASPDVRAITMTKKSETSYVIAPKAVAAFNFFLRNPTHPDLEVWHEGRCGKCGRALTDPESIEKGIGPICRQNAQ